nr:hypothetical protein [Actinomycetota bacterium]
VPVTAAGIGIVAVLAAGYAAAGPSGLIDAAALAAVGVLFVARGTIPGGTPRLVRPRTGWRKGEQRPADFPAYAKIASDLEWAQMSRRHYEYAVRPMLARLAAALGRPDAMTAGRHGPPSADLDGPGVDLATLERIIAALEGEGRP